MTEPNSDTLPTGLELTPLSEEYRLDPYPMLEKMRQQAPAFEDDQLRRFIYTKHDDVKAILRDKEFFCDPRKANPGTFTREFLGAGLGEEDAASMLFMDEPDHLRLRSLVSAPFTPKAVERWRPRTKDIVQRILATINGTEFDLISAFAGPVPTVVIAELLGIDASRHSDFKEWSDLSVQIGFNPAPTPEQAEQGAAALASLEDFFTQEIMQRRAQPGDDLLSDMTRAEEAGDRLTTQEIINQCNLLLVAGNVTTTDLIGNGVKALLEHPEQLAKLREQPELIKNTVEEILRFDSPVTNSGRINNRDIAISGCPVKTGESLLTSLSAANRDPDIYPNPNRFDIEREDTHHQSFGGGRHLCLGAHLARLEAQEAILGLLQHFPNLSLSPKGHVYHAIPSFRGMSELWLSTGENI